MGTSRKKAVNKSRKRMEKRATAAASRRAARSSVAKKFVPKELEIKARLYEERNKLYGDNYKRFGPILSLILKGQKLDPNNAHQMNRLGIFVQVVTKVTRYGENFTSGGHNDSLDDIAVYTMMLKELDVVGDEIVIECI